MKNLNDSIFVFIEAALFLLIPDIGPKNILVSATIHFLTLEFNEIFKVNLDLKIHFLKKS